MNRFTSKSIGFRPNIGYYIKYCPTIQQYGWMNVSWYDRWRYIQYETINADNSIDDLVEVERPIDILPPGKWFINPDNLYTVHLMRK